MAIIGTILAFEVVEGVGVVTVDVADADTLTVDYLTPVGEDSQPIPGDFVQLVENTGTGERSAVAYHDVKNPRNAQPGEKITYARSAAGEAVVTASLLASGRFVVSNESGEFFLDPNGAYTAKNKAGAMKLLESGTIDLNGVTISPDGAVTIPVSLTLAELEIAGHSHRGDSGGNTGPNQ